MAEANSGQPKVPGKKKGPDPLVGRTVNDRFKITAVIARGGMGKVYRAEQAPLGREVALKVLNPNYSGDHDPEFHKRFFLEASISSKLNHPNTVTIFDYGRTDDDVYYIAMELLEGRTLHRALRDEGPFDSPRTMHIARQICRSLREAHQMGVIHRDLKPANVFLVAHGDEQDFAKVLDFGLVKNLSEKGEDLTQTGLFMGSPKYMSPEQIRGEGVDGRCDIYALGVMMYEMLTGKVPFDRPNSVNILMAHVHEAVPAMSETNPECTVTPILEHIVMKCMAKRAEDRFATMDELLAALKQAAGDAGLSVSMSGDFNLTGEHQMGAGGVTGSYPAIGVDGSTPPPPMGSNSAGLPLSYAPDAPQSNNKSMIIGGLLVLAGIAGGAAALMSGDAPEPPAEQTAVASQPVPQPTEPLEPATPDEEGPAAVAVTLRSTPAGAMVVVNGQKYGPTPTTVEWTGDFAQQGRDVTLRFEKEGFRDFTVTRRVMGKDLDVMATLDKEAAAAEARPTRRRRRIIRRANMRQEETETDSTATVGPVKGYKTDPY